MCFHFIAAVVFHCMYKSHSSILLLLEIGLFPVFWHYKQRCCKHPCICHWVNKCTTFSRVYTKAELLNRVGARSDFRDAAKLSLLNTAVLSTGCSAELLVELYKDPTGPHPRSVASEPLARRWRHLYFWKDSPVIHLHILSEEPLWPPCSLDLTPKTLSQVSSLGVPWWRIYLLMQGTWVQFLVWEDSTCLAASKPGCHNYWACTLEPMIHSKRSHHKEKPTCHK